MFKRIAAIAFIFGCTAVAWAILGSTIFYRTYNAESGLSGRVASTWGASQAQAPPMIAREWKEEKTVEVEEKGKKTTRTESYLRSEPVKIDASRVTAGLHIDYRQKGLLWFSSGFRRGLYVSESYGTGRRVCDSTAVSGAAGGV